MVRIRPIAAVGGHRSWDKLPAFHVKHMDLALFHHIVPAVQGQGPGLYLLSHHGVAHEAFELQDHRALLAAAQGLGRDLHWQGRFAAELQPGFEVFGLRRLLFVQSADAAAVAVATDHDARDLEVEYRKLNRRRGAVETG